MALEVPGELRPELDHPAADGLVADLDATLREQLLNVTKAERKAEVEPHGMADHIGWEPMPLER